MLVQSKIKKIKIPLKGYQLFMITKHNLKSFKKDYIKIVPNNKTIKITIYNYYIEIKLVKLS